MLLDEGRDELGDLVLLSSWESGDLSEELLHLAGGTAFDRSFWRHVGVAEKVLDGDAEDTCDLWDGV